MSVEVKWEEINKVLHNLKYSVGMLNKIEKLLKSIREEMVAEQEELENIILSQPERQEE